MGVENSYKYVSASAVSATVVTGSGPKGKCGLPQNNTQVTAAVLSLPMPQQRPVQQNNVTNNFFLLVPRDFDTMPGVPVHQQHPPQQQDSFSRMMERFQQFMLRNLLIQQIMQNLLEMEIIRLMVQVIQKMLLLDLLKALLSRESEKRSLKQEISQLEEEVARTLELALDKRTQLAALAASVLA